MSAARLIAAMDAAAALIRAGWLAVAPDGVTRAYTPPINLTPDAAPQLAGRQVFVFGTWSVREQLTREAQLREYRIRPLLVEQYADGPDDPPTAWVDERVRFFEQQVFDPLADPGLKLIDGMTPDWETNPATVDEWCSLDVLLHHKTVWAYATITFVEETTNAGVPAI